MRAAAFRIGLTLPLSIALAFSLVPVASGQTAPAQSAPNSAPAPGRIPSPQDLEPGVSTSSPASPASSASDPGARPSPEDSTAAPPAAASAGSKRESPREARATDTAAKAHDRIQLDTTQITGNRELPKVLYIVPWKRSDLGDLVGKPVNSLLDEVLTPVDRDVFKRQNRYYDALKPDAVKPAPGAAGPTTDQQR